MPKVKSTPRLKHPILDDQSIGYICSDCATKHGAKWPDGHQATFHHAECHACKLSKDLCAVSDWEWPSQPEIANEREV